MTNEPSDPEGFFFKYMNEETAKLVLANNTLRWSTPKRLNDPFDLQFDLHLNFDRELIKRAVLQNLWDGHYAESSPKVGNLLGELVAYSRGKIPQIPRKEFDADFGQALDESLAHVEKMLPQTNVQLREELDRAKVLCLSKTPVATLMWSHYADSHRGVVFGFRDVSQLDSPWKAGRPIDYVDRVPPLIDEQALIELLSGRRNLEPASLIEKLVFTKSIVWAYEKEWRIYSGVGRNEFAPFEDIPFHPLELGMVILGCHMPKSSKRALFDQISSKYPHAGVFQAVKMPGTFDLSVVAHQI